VADADQDGVADGHSPIPGAEPCGQAPILRRQLCSVAGCSGMGGLGRGRA
jgi:hypothetical protein